LNHSNFECASKLLSKKNTCENLTYLNSKVLKHNKSSVLN
jgi:hypothetical protein